MSINKLMTNSVSNSNNTVHFRKQLSEYNNRFKLILSDFKKFYIAYNLDTDSSDALNAFTREKTMITHNKKNIFLLKNKVEKSNSEINKQIHQLELLLNKEQRTNNSLTVKEKDLESLDNAAIQMLKDKNVVYNERLITIFNISIGIITTGIIIYKIPSI